MRWLIFLLFATLVTLRHALGANVEARYSCSIHLRSDRSISSTVLALLKEHQDEAAQICTTARGTLVQYNSVTSVLRGHFGVCAFEVLSYSSGRRTIERTSTFMTQGGATCPAQSDPIYVGASGVSEGMFALLARFASDLRSSPNGIDAKWAVDQRYLKGKESDSNELRTELLAKSPRKKLKLTGIALAEPLLSDSFGYKLIFRSEDWQNQWVIMVDMTPRGLKVLNFDRIR